MLELDHKALFVAARRAWRTPLTLAVLSLRGTPDEFEAAADRCTIFRIDPAKVPLLRYNCRRTSLSVSSPLC
jgi:hypothetical protein